MDSPSHHCSRLSLDQGHSHSHDFIPPPKGSLSGQVSPPLDFTNQMLSETRGSQLGMTLLPMGHAATSRHVPGCYTWGGRVLRAWSRQRPGMLLNILWLPEQPNNKEPSRPKMPIKLRLRNRGLDVRLADPTQGCRSLPPCPSPSRHPSDPVGHKFASPVCRPPQWFTCLMYWVGQKVHLRFSM